MAAVIPAVAPPIKVLAAISLTRVEPLISWALADGVNTAANATDHTRVLTSAEPRRRADMHYSSMNSPSWPTADVLRGQFPNARRVPQCALSTYCAIYEQKK